MKKAYELIIAAVLLIGVAFWMKASEAEIYKKIDDAHIYLFYQNGCPHCHHAMDYIKEKYPNLVVEYRDLAKQENIVDFQACAKKFKLPKRELGTPLICMGKNFILGWSEKKQNNFDEYVKPFMK